MKFTSHASEADHNLQCPDAKFHPPSPAQKACLTKSLALNIERVPLATGAQAQSLLFVWYQSSLSVFCLGLQIHCMLRHCPLQGLNSLREVIQVLSDVRQTQGLNLTSLQLSLLQRDFDEHDYDSLLALDLEVGHSKQEQVSQEQLQKLATFKHPAR